MPHSEDAPAEGMPTSEVFIPLATGRQWFGEMQVKIRAGGRDMEEVELHEIVVEVDRPENVPLVAAAAREMLAQNHEQQDYEIIVPLELLLRAEETKRIFSIVLGSIASISLLVGGIGIMNVMLATVTERTREIGIRRALGAKRRHIVAQFLVETVVLSVGGGLLGVALGLTIPGIVESTRRDAHDRDPGGAAAGLRHLGRHRRRLRPVPGLARRAHGPGRGPAPRVGGGGRCRVDSARDGLA